MKRNTTIALVLVLAVSGLAVGAASFDALFTNTDSIQDDEVQLTVANSEYAELDGNDQLNINMTDLQPNATVTAEVFNATYKAENTSNASIYVNESSVPAGVDDITDSAGNSIVGDQNPYNFSDDGETDATFSLTVNTEETTNLEDTIGIVASAEAVDLEDEPPEDVTVFNGTVTDANNVTAPEGTEIVATANGTEVANTTVDENGVYGDSGFDNDIAYEAAEDDEVQFFVRDVDGPVRTTGPYTVNADDIGSIVQEDLEFDEGTFDLQVLEFTVNESVVEPGETISVSADLTNNGSVTLDQTANFSVNGDVVDNQSVSVEGGEFESVEFTHTVESSSDIDVEISTDDDAASQTVEVDGDTVFTGTVTDTESVTAPEGTEIVATVDDQQATATVDDQGVYSGLELNITADDTVEFALNNTDNPTINVSFTENEIGTTVTEDLTFDGDIFALRVNNFSVNETEVATGETISVSADLTHNGTVELNQLANFSVENDVVENESVAVEGGEIAPVEFTYTVTESDDIDVEISTDDDADSQTVFVVSIGAVDTAALDNDFAGIALDDDQLGITADGVEAPDGSLFNDTAPIALNVSGTVVELGDVNVDEGSIDATVDTTQISNDEVVGDDGTLEIETVQTDATVTLVHEAQSFETGSTVTSVPLAGQLYTEGSFSAVQWDESTNSYSSNDLDTDGSFTDATSVHRGLFVLTQDEDLRFGWEFQEADFGDNDQITLEDGWNLVSSNYNISDERISIEEDLDIVGANVNVLDANDGTFPDVENDDSEEFGAYWVYTSGDRDRTLDNSTYSASDR